MLKFLAPWLRAKHDVDIYSSLEFKAVLKQERCRAERHKRVFCLIVFDVTLLLRQSSRLPSLVFHMKKRLRCTDVIGWLEQKKIAVLLPETMYENAQCLAEQLVSFTDEMQLTYDVHVYPDSGSKKSLDKFSGKQDIKSITTSQQSRQYTSTPTRLSKTSSTLSPVPANDMTSIFSERITLCKRLIDVIGSFIMIVLLSPLFAAIAVAIKVVSQGPVFFPQKRVGHHGDAFTMYKFRSMVVDAEKLKKKLAKQNHRTGPAFKMKNDPRVIPLGNFLRRTSLDELPQLFNVLKGDMTLVGPRPPLPEEVSRYDLWHQKRMDVTPGITCIWQVRSRHNKNFDHWVREDIEYIRRRSLWLDVKILLRTIPAVLSGKGAW